MDNVRAFDVLVIGAGPAGIAAACGAAEAGARVGIVDNNPRVGGQIWRGETQQHADHLEAKFWLGKFSRHAVEFFPSTEVVDQIDRGHLLAQSEAGPCEFVYKSLILCTGARELFLPFPGWTLPNVMGAGALQALAKSGLSISGKKVIIAGSGPLLLAVAAYLQEHGADTRLIAEQAPRHRLARFGVSLFFERSKFKQALAIRRQLAGIPYKANCWPVRASGNGKLESVTLRCGEKTWQEACDYLACGFHLVPNTELAVLLGCEIRGGFVRVYHLQQSSVNGIFCAGELTGIGGVDASILEGSIAGYAAAGQEARAAQLARRKPRSERFTAALRRAFSLRTELRAAVSPDTIVCRCEDVPFGRLRSCAFWRAAKLQTRCGMGPCQGRICGPAIEFLLGWKASSIRPPAFPVPIETLARTPLSQLSRSSEENLIPHEEPR